MKLTQERINKAVLKREMNTMYISESRVTTLPEKQVKKCDTCENFVHKYYGFEFSFDYSPHSGDRILCEDCVIKLVSGGSI